MYPQGSYHMGKSIPALPLQQASALIWKDRICRSHGDYALCPSALPAKNAKEKSSCDCVFWLQISKAFRDTPGTKFPFRIPNNMVLLPEELKCNMDRSFLSDYLWLPNKGKKPPSTQACLFGDMGIRLRAERDSCCKSPWHNIMWPHMGLGSSTPE